MIARSMRYASLVIVLSTVAPSAQQPATPPAFRFERPIVTGGAGPRRLQVDIPLLVGSAAGLRDLRIFDASGAEVEYLTVVDSKPAPALMTPLVVERRPSEPGRSRFRLRLPGGRLPIAALHLDVAEGHVFRDVKVLEARLSGTQLAPVVVGRGTLTRAAGGNLTAADLRIAIESPTEAQLDLEVDDGDNLQGVTAELGALPWIYVNAPAGALTARYGNSTLSAPNYGLEATREQIHIDEVPNATWGEARARGAQENAANAGAEPPLPTVGASLHPDLFKYVRTIPAGHGGLTAVALDAGVLAHSAGPDRGFADLRVVDTSNRQVPYVIERTAEPLPLDLAAEKMSAPPPTLSLVRSGRSVYRIAYPFDGLPASRLVLTTSARVFERRVSVAEEREPDRQGHRDRWIDTLATARWVHADQDKPAMPLTLDMPPLHAAEVLVIVEEGDNTALPLAGARLLLPSYRLRLFREANAPLRAVYGRAGEPMPQYDLAMLATQVLGAVATDVALDAEQPIRPPETTAAILSPRLFWVALTIAVIVLLGLIARMLKQESGN
jgi:hypothetical protein